MQATEVVAVVPAPGELRVERVVVEAERILIVAGARRRRAACPVCGGESARVHGRYERRLADLPWHGLAVALRVQVRRFVCEVPGCPRRIFCERLPETAGPYARRTRRLAAALERIALALGGEAGARLARALGLAGGASADTLLRVVKAPSEPTPADGPPVRVLGVDDWAWRKGQRYGTVLVDLERRRVVDLLPDREPATLAAWLRAPPGVEVVSRDRGGAYAEGAALGAPSALQVADRFHLFRNLTDAVLRHVERHRHLLRGVGRPRDEAAAAAPTPPGRTGPRTRDARAKAAVRGRRLALYTRIVELHAQGWSGVAIAREVGLVRQTVMRWLHRGSFPERRVGPGRRRPVARYAAYLAQRWREGCRNARRLEHEIRGLGYQGGHTAVGDWIRTHLGRRAAGTGGPPRATPRLTARRAAWLLTAPDARLSPEERAWRASVLATTPDLDELHRAARRFRELFESHDGAALGRWIRDAVHGPLAAFARGLRRDHAAVEAAITEPWSQGQVEGQVHRLKLIKRTMYGRASFALLRRRVLAA